MKRSKHQKHAHRLAAHGAHVIERSRYESHYEGFRMPKAPACPQNLVNGDDAQQFARPMLTEDWTMRAERKPPPPDMEAPYQKDSQVILKLPQLSAEEWQDMHGLKESSEQRRKKEAKTEAKTEAITEAKTQQEPSLPKRLVADDDMILKMQKLSVHVREGKTTSADGVGRILSLSDKHKTALIMEMFHQHDVDGSGTLDVKELMPLLTEVTEVLYPEKKIVIIEEEAKCFARWADHNGDGVLDAMDLSKAMEWWDLYCDMKQDIEQVLSRYDADMSGGLDMDEFQEMLQDLAKMNGFEAPTNVEFKTIFTLADVNSNGKIDKAEIIFAMSTYIQVKQQQTLGNQYHPLLHKWIQQRLEFIFYYVRSCEWHQEVYNEVVMMKPGRKVKKYMEDVITASFEISRHSKSAQATIRTNVEKLVQQFLEELEAKQRKENKANPWIYAKILGELDFMDSQIAGA